MHLLEILRQCLLAVHLMIAGNHCPACHNLVAIAYPL
jgi:hypothetical protein